MRRSLKFLHILGAIGLMGSMAALLVMGKVAPTQTRVDGYAGVYAAMAAVAKWLLMPSLALSLLAGLLAMAVNRTLHGAAWAWIKLATGVLLFEGSLQNILGPLSEEAERSAALVTSGQAAIGASAAGNAGAAIWVLGAVALVNVFLGVWRPNLFRLPS